MVDTTNWFPKVLRKDFTVGMVVSENGLDDPDQNFYENYLCGAAPLPSTDGTLQLRDRWFDSNLRYRARHSMVSRLRPSRGRSILGAAAQPSSCGRPTDRSEGGHSRSRRSH